MAADPPVNTDDPQYIRAARLLAQKLGIDWRDLPTEQVLDYARKIEIARKKPPKPEGDHSRGS